MRNMLAFFAAMALAFVGTGWYLNWFSFRSVPAPTTNQRSVTIDFNTQKMGEDLLKAEQKLIEKAKTANATPSTPVAQPVHKVTQDLNIPGIDFSGDN